MTTRDTLDTWLFLLDEILLDAQVDGPGRQQSNISRLRASILMERNAPITGDFGPVPKPPRTPSFVGSAIMREAKASIALDGETQSIEPLPPMQPIAGRRIKSKDLKCTTCGAKPGTECFEMTNRGPSAEPTNTRRADGSTTHMARRRAAKVANGD
jgi:hypothetical protein